MRISFSCPYFVLEFVLLAQYLVDALDEDVVGRIAHGSVPMTGYLIKLGIGTTYKSHHSPYRNSPRICQRVLCFGRPLSG